VRANLGKPIFFKQVRPGKDGKLFAMYKFRTMQQARDAAGNQQPDEERMTRLGQWLRSTSLDELPELWNVIRGDMSLVGPRPLLVKYLERYNEQQTRRHEVRPGLTGLAQVNGRNAISWEEKFELDVQYVDAYSLRMDLQILGQTVYKVLRRSDVSAQGFATMPEFAGSSSTRVDGRLAA
jgi:sugar transferase EpsL